MSAVQGFATSYDAIRDIHQDLTINGAGGDEYEFLSGFSEDPYSPQPMLHWSQWMDYVLFNKQYKTAAQSEAMLAAAIARQEAKMPANSTENNSDTGIYTPLCKAGTSSIYDVLKNDPRLSKIKELVDYVGYGKMFDSEYPITFFAPINDRFDEILEWPLKISYKPVAALQTLRYHILPYKMKAWQMVDRKLKMRTDLEQQPIECDWTQGRRLLINPITTKYMAPPAGSFTNPPGDPYSGRVDSFFPTKEWEVQMGVPIECVNGIVYVISRPLCPPDLL